MSSGVVGMSRSRSSTRGSVFIEAVNQILQAVSYKVAFDLFSVHTRYVKQHADIGKLAERAFRIVLDGVRFHCRQVLRPRYRDRDASRAGVHMHVGENLAAGFTPHLHYIYAAQVGVLVHGKSILHLEPASQRLFTRCDR